MSFWSDKQVLVTGGHGFLGQWVCKELIKSGCPSENICVPSSAKYDLRLIENCLAVTKGVDVVIHLAGKDGGLAYNMCHPGSIFYDNAVMNLQMMEAARRNDVSKFVFAGSAASYPANASLPLQEDEYQDGNPADGNASYGLAKKLHLIQAESYYKEYGLHSVHLLLTNMYGPGDVFDPQRSRVAASVIRKFCDAEKNGLDEVVMWGSGNAAREFLYIEDAARAFILAAERCCLLGPINVGSGVETSIRELAETVADIVGFSGNIIWDTTKPEGQMRRCSDVSLAKKEFGFVAGTSLRDGIKKTVEWYLNSQ